MEPFFDLLRQYPELAVFLTLAIGFYVGRLKIGGCAIGSVTGVLLTGLIIGQADIPISPAIKAIFFLFFLFAVRELKMLAEGDAERYQVVRAISLVTMTITPYVLPEPWNTVAVLAGLLGLVGSFFLKPKGCW